MKITYSKNNTKIHDCYKLNNKQIEEASNKIIAHRTKCNLPITRTKESYISEIKAHKRLYLFGIARSHTKDCDCEENINKKLEVGFKIIGF